MAIMLMAMASCVNDSSDCPATPAAMTEGVRLKFSIMTGNDNPVRGADTGGDLTGSGVENYLDISDIRYLIFDKNRQYLTDITPDTKTVTANDRYSVYNVVAKITDKYFFDNLEGTVDFYIMTLANHSGWGIDMPRPERGDRMESLFEEGLTMTTLPRAGGLTADPAHLRQYFPMAGLQHYRVPGSMVATSSEGTPYDLSLATGKDVNMLRALAKIEIIDKINIKEGAIFDDSDNQGQKGWMRIDKVELDGFMDRGNLLPSESRWNTNGVFETQQVSVSSVPKSAKYMTPPALYPDNSIDNDDSKGYILNFVADEYARSLRRDNCPVFSGYVFEYSKFAPQMDEVDTSRMPYFRVTTRGHTDRVSGEVLAESMVLPVRMAKYTNGSASPQDNLDALLRNHIYRFEISGIGQELNVKWTVCDMDRAYAEIEFN